MNDELVLAIPASVLSHIFPFQGFRAFGPVGSNGPMDQLMNTPSLEFVPRHEVEDDPTWKQLIVYSMVTSYNRVFVYERGKAGGEARLHALLSVGIGGHVNPEDLPRGVDLGGITLRSLLSRAAVREINEELAVHHVGAIGLIGLVNDDSDDVGRVHLGFAFTAHSSYPNAVPRTTSVIRSPRWEQMRDILPDVERCESWTRAIVRAMNPHMARVAVKGKSADVRPITQDGPQGPGTA
jgi:predicted NUDIX family phosphoesterase